MTSSVVEIINAIQLICQRYQNHLLTPVECYDVLTKDLSVSQTEILNSITNVSELVNNLPPLIDESMKHVIHFNDLIMRIKAVSSLISQKKDLFKIDTNASIPLLSLLGKEWDENFHSDYFAQILNTSRMGPYSTLLLENIISTFTSNLISLDGCHIKVEREKFLADFNAPKDIEKRRIDLFITASNFHIIIENKINSFELEDQTKDYYNSVADYYSADITKGKKNIVALLLSPAKLIARDPHFKSLSYVELTRIMLATPQEGLTESMKTFLNLYIKSISYSFVEKETKYENELQEFWRKVG